MNTLKKTLIKEGIQNFKYELMFIKHKLDLVENLISGLEEKVDTQDLNPDLEEKLLNARVKLLMDEYQKLHSMINPKKIKFDNNEEYVNQTYTE